MITGTRVERTVEEWHFTLPLNARDINDAIYTVNTNWAGGYDDDFIVTSDGDELIFTRNK
jgi:hypothetical protein